ncbi:LOW QUALITY PROTEIN: hypothetical protein PoB_004145100 [Plakobranchus ocellatus]|uniref:Uncharacterized protein n=1 Tax=Plakobranchus ocellatus TaxID=259542 RepID=A0AAV4B3A9_9GAST|nr:LOW QUALITY PROTEIN: hypothetical protein PoB_004145100 [Plakobranchus ocellatus]
MNLIGGNGLVGIRSSVNCTNSTRLCVRVKEKGFEFLYIASPQQGDLRLSGPLSGQGAGTGARTRNRRVPADLRADSQATVLPTPPERERGLKRLRGELGGVRRHTDIQLARWTDIQRRRAKVSLMVDGNKKD